MPSNGRRMLNKVPEITLYFWVIKILCTTVGETFADNLNENLGLGLTNTSYIMGAVLIAVLVAQFRSRRYVPGIYWLAVVLVSVVGTLVSDNLVENYGVALETTTIAFSLCLIATFATWFWSERTLSVHTIVTTKRESFYWATILFTFALGTSAGDLISEKLELGYLPTVGIFAAAIAVIAFCHFALKLNAILSFWLAYVLTRPLGASIGDYLASPTKEGGLGLGTTVASIIFLSTILALVVFLAITKRDVIRTGPVAAPPGAGPAVLVVLNKVDADRGAAGRGRGGGPSSPRRPSACSSPIPTTSASTTASCGGPTGASCWRGRSRGSATPSVPRSRGGWRRARTPTTTSSKNSIAGPSPRSSWRRRRPTSRTGCTSTYRPGWPSSACRPRRWRRGGESHRR